MIPSLEPQTILDLLACGAIATAWMVGGVYVCGRLYPGYSHRRQAMSELGARGCPTARIHPFINNFPIGLLFTAFGIGALALLHRQALPKISALLLIAHGLSHIVTGLFPIDADPGARGTSSLGHKIHGMAGLAMYFALLFACVLWVFIGAPATPALRIYSLASAIVSCVSLACMARGFKTGRDVGLHQRISYGVLALWCAVLSVWLYRI